MEQAETERERALFPSVLYYTARREAYFSFLRFFGLYGARRPDLADEGGTGI